MRSRGDIAARNRLRCGAPLARQDLPTAGAREVAVGGVSEISFRAAIAIEIDAEDQILAKGTEPYRSVPVEPYQVLSRGKPRAPLSRSIDELSKRDRR